MGALSRCFLKFNCYAMIPKFRSFFQEFDKGVGTSWPTEVAIYRSIPIGFVETNRIEALGSMSQIRFLHPRLRTPHIPNGVTLQKHELFQRPRQM